MLVYDDCKITGPYRCTQTDGSIRNYVNITFSNGKRITRAYSRYLMECHLNRILETHEHVHHKDDDTLNDVLSNYEILDISKHQSLHGNLASILAKKKYFEDEVAVCDYCEQPFNLTIDKQRNRDKVNNGRTVCSRRCSTKLYYREFKGGK